MQTSEALSLMVSISGRVKYRPCGTRVGVEFFNANAVMLPQVFALDNPNYFLMAVAEARNVEAVNLTAGDDSTGLDETSSVHCLLGTDDGEHLTLRIHAAGIGKLRLLRYWGANRSRASTVCCS